MRIHSAGRCALLCVAGVFVATACTTHVADPAGATSSSPRAVSGSSSIASSAGSTTTTPASSADASTLPTQVWVDANVIPLNSTEQWPSVAGSAHSPMTKFWVDDFCASPNPVQFKVADSGVALIGRGEGNWSVQQTIMHYPGDPYRMGQSASADFMSLTESLSGCGSGKAEVTTKQTRCPTDSSGICEVMAAELTGGSKNVTAHVYLAQAGSAITELVVWSTGTAAHPWVSTGDMQVLMAMTPQLCSAWQC